MSSSARALTPPFRDCARIAITRWFYTAARQGFRWWEIDVTYYVLRAIALCALVWDLKPVPAGLQRRR